MATRSRGFRSGTRYLLRKRRDERRRSIISSVIREYKPGDRVHIVINPSIHKGMPHPRFHGKTGVVIERRGRAYLIQVRDGNSYKFVIARPEHLKPQVLE